MTKIEQFKALEKIWAAMQEDVVEDNDVDTLLQEGLRTEAILKYAKTNRVPLSNAMKAIDSLCDEMEDSVRTIPRPKKHNGPFLVLTPSAPNSPNGSTNDE